MKMKRMERAMELLEKAEDAKYGVQYRDIEMDSIRSVEGEGNERKFEVSFSSEVPYRRYFGDEILCHDDGAVDMSRLNTIGCVLFNHNRDRIMGKIIKASIKDKRGIATIEFDKDPDAEMIYQKVLNGTLKGISVGYQVQIYEDVKKGAKSSNGRFKGPCYVATKWMPYEISIVSVPADGTVGVGREVEVAPVQPKTGVSSFYYDEKQLQINQNFIGGKKV